MSRTDEGWLARAVALASSSVDEGGGPFGAVVVAGGRVLAEGQNRVTLDHDPTAHAEIQAIRAACRGQGRFSLAGATLFASCEPCPMCSAASLWARLDRVVYAADRHDAARAGFDDRELHELVARDPATWPTRVDALAVTGRTRPFDAWLARADRVTY